MVEFVEKTDLDKWGADLKREIYAEVEDALLKASIIQAPVVPKEELDTPRINLEDAFPEGASAEQMDSIENKDKVNLQDRGWTDLKKVMTDGNQPKEKDKDVP